MKLASAVCSASFSSSGALLASALFVLAAVLGGCASGTTPEGDAGPVVGIDAAPPDSGPPDSGRPDTGVDAGQDAGQDGGVCAPTCTADVDCAITCPGTSGVTSCCDRITHTCYATAAAVCPLPPADAGVTMPY